MAYTATKNELKKKKCLACKPENAEKSIKEFYISKNPMHSDGFVPWCKECIKSNSVLDSGEIDEDKFKSVLQQLNKPYYKDVLQSAIQQYKKEHSFVPEENVKYYGGDIIGLYFKNLNTLRQTVNKSYLDSEQEGFIRKSGTTILKSDVVKQSKTSKSTYDIGDFEATDDIKDLFGYGYEDTDYKKMHDKYEKLKLNYTLQTNLHQESLATYVRFKVKEEDATVRGDVDEAKKWYDAAQNAANNGKLMPKQLSKADLDSGVNSVSELVKAVEQAVDVIKILPQFKYRANDAPDFNIFCYVNYERDLNGQAQVDYSDIYSFYDNKKREYIEQNGDPYGIFANDTTIKNRKTVEIFTKLPDDYDDLAGGEND